MSGVMEGTVIDWVEELRGLEPVQAAKAILSALGTTRQRDLRTLAYALTAWAMLAKEEEKRVQSSGPGHLGAGGLRKDGPGPSAAVAAPIREGRFPHVGLTGGAAFEH